MAPIRVLLSGGGTGGHLVPGLNVARVLLARGHQVTLVRTGRAVESAFLDRSHGPDGLDVEVLGMRGGNLALPFTMSRHLVHARELLQRKAPDVVVGLGGRGSLPCVLAAWTRRTPIALLEQNLQPGRTTRFAARLARAVYTTFPETATLLKGRPVVACGTPLAPEFTGATASADRRRFGLERASTIVLVLGGSQGATALNTHVPRLLAALDPGLRERLGIIHVAGRGKESVAVAAYAGSGLEVHVLSFWHDMPSLYALADLVICRAGGMTLAEIAAAGRAAVFVPYPWHRDQHQVSNAAWLERRGAARVLDQRSLEQGQGRELLAQLLADDVLRAKLASHAKSALPVDAAARIAHGLERLAGLPAKQHQAG